MPTKVKMRTNMKMLLQILENFTLYDFFLSVHFFQMHTLMIHNILLETIDRKMKMPLQKSFHIIMWKAKIWRLRVIFWLNINDVPPFSSKQASHTDCPYDGNTVPLFWIPWPHQISLILKKNSHLYSGEALSKREEWKNMTQNLYICKWMFFAILSFAIMKEIPSLFWYN